MLFKIPRLYDSHAHFLGTGQIRMGLSLHELKNASDVQKIQVQEGYLRGEWLIGFGWDENKWFNSALPTKEILDNVFPDRPVFFSRADGHSSWVNSKALEILGCLNKTAEEFPDPVGGQIRRDAHGLPTGILSESAHMSVFGKLPSFTAAQTKLFLLKACEIFNAAGFTHVRDMSGTEDQWQQLSLLEDQKLLTVALDANYTVEGLEDLQRALRDCLAARKSESMLLRAKGLKVFFDGSLGSETALLSQCYPSHEPHKHSSGKNGIVGWDLKDLEMAIRSCWENNLEISVHTIGDEAVHQIVTLARKISAEGAVGKLNLEHAQVIRPETIQLMKPLHMRCHMQPCHWLADRRWLKEKLGSLYPYAFPWEALRLAQIPVSFGSDSPIERPSLADNLQALRESPAEGIRAFKGDPLQFHSHPDKNFTDSYSVFEGDLLKEVFFNGRLLSI